MISWCCSARRTLLMVGLLWLCTCAWAAAQSPRGVYDAQALRALAEQGDKRAAFLLASHYAVGRGVPRDDSEAVRWYTVAAEGGLAEAQYNLGIMYVTGRGVPLDRAKAAQWYERAAEQGLAEAQFNLGTLYGTGRGVRRDEVLAVKWLTRAAERGLARAQYNLGTLYEHGRGVRVNVHTALEWYRKAAEHGLDEAKLRGAALAKKMQITSKPRAVGEAKLVTGAVSPRQGDGSNLALNSTPRVGPGRAAQTLPEAKTVQSDAQGVASALGSPTKTTPNLLGLDWVREAPAEHFTMQLASFASLAEAQRFARELGAAMPLGIFETSSRGKPWFAVIRGVYTSRAEATTAVGELSERLRIMKPWVRNLGQLRKHIP